MSGDKSLKHDTITSYNTTNVKNMFMFLFDLVF